MPLRRPALYILAIAVLSACATPTELHQPDNIDFARGCWIDRATADSHTTTLRLLPSRTGAARLEGEILGYSNQPDASAPTYSQVVAFDLDGSHAVLGDRAFSKASAPTRDAPAAGWVRVAWMSEKQPSTLLLLESDGDHLTLQEGYPPDGHSSLMVIFFQGARDGCD